MDVKHIRSIMNWIKIPFHPTTQICNVAIYIYWKLNEILSKIMGGGTCVLCPLIAHFSLWSPSIYTFQPLKEKVAENDSEVVPYYKSIKVPYIYPWLYGRITLFWKRNICMCSFAPICLSVQLVILIYTILVPKISFLQEKVIENDRKVVP